MAMTRTLSDFTYRSGGAGTFYYFTVSLNQSGGVSVKNIQSPNGRIVDPQTSIPQSVTDDIQVAIEQVEDLVAQTSAVNGQLVFAAETSKAVVFAIPFAGTNYRVVFSPGDFIAVKVTSKLTTGFTVQTSTSYTGTLGYDVFV